MAFIEKTDFESSIHIEILDAITRGEDSVWQKAVAAAITEMSGYLNARYDTAVIFAAAAEQRNPVILLFAKDIALYHAHSVHNPQKIPDIRVKRYDDAIAWLKGVNRQEINPPGLPVPETEGKPFVQWNSNSKRTHHF